MSAKRYFKFDEFNQYLDNEADINYYAVNQARRVAIGNMLGDYDEYGYYAIDEEIIKELVAMPKIIVDSVEGIDLLRGAIKFDNFIHFMLVIEDDKAKLVLLEKINFESNIKYNVGRYSNMNEYVLQEIAIPDRDVDKNVVYSKFNIKREDEGMLYDFKDMNQDELYFYKALIQKMKYNALAQTVLLTNEKAIEVIEADYFDNVLNAFDKYAQYKQEFIKYLKSIILEKQNFIQINRPFFQKTVNEILDSTVSVFLSKLPASVRAEIEEEIRKVKEKYFYEFNKILHLQFVSNENAKANEDSFISNIMSMNRDDKSKLISLEVDKEKLKDSYLAILENREQVKEKVDAKNADKKVITDDNPTLKKFFGEIEKETGNDLLKPQKNDKEEKVEVAPKPQPKKVAKPSTDRIIPRKTEETKKAEKPTVKPVAKPVAKPISKPAQSVPTQKPVAKPTQSATTHAPASNVNNDLSGSKTDSTAGQKPTNTNNTANPVRRRHYTSVQPIDFEDNFSI